MSETDSLETEALGFIIAGAILATILLIYLLATHFLG